MKGLVGFAMQTTTTQPAKSKRTVGRIRRSATVSFLLFGLALAPGVEGREFESVDGRIIQADLVSLKGESAVIRMANGRTFTVPIDRFSAKDRKYFETWKEEQKKTRVPRLSVDVNSGRKDSRNRSGDFDDRKGSFEYKVQIANQEMDFDIEQASGTLVVFGESFAHRGENAVLQRLDFKLDLASGETATWKAPLVHYSYDDRNYAKHGHKVEGYVLVLKNKAGKTIYTKAIPSKWADYAEEAITFKKRQVVDRNLRPLNRTHTFYLR